MQVVPSSLNAVNKLLGGWYSGTVMNLFGHYLAGKTLLTLQEACYLSSKLGGDIVLFDVDGGGQLFVNEWLPVFSLRFGKLGNVYVIQSFNMKYPSQSKVKIELKMFEHFGVHARVEISEGGKAAFIAYSTCEPLIEKLYSQGARIFIIDSFSQLHKDAFPSTASFGERARAEDMLYSIIKMFLASHPDSFIFLNHHVSINPMTNSVDPSGGSAVIQNSKLALMLSKRPKEPEGRLYVYRHPRKPPWSEYASIKFNEGGIWDA